MKALRMAELSPMILQDIAQIAWVQRVIPMGFAWAAQRIMRFIHMACAAMSGQHGAADLKLARSEPKNLSQG